MSSVLTISAVDNTTEKITITAHGRSTGDGPAAVFVGSGGVIPGGLAPVTDYWVIVVDANTVKLATSSANALAGTAINITSNGTLPLQLLLGIPYRRPRTAAPGVEIIADDDNTVWDTMVALWNLLTGQAQSLWSAITFAVQLVANAGIVAGPNQHMAVSGTGLFKHGTRTLTIISNGAVSTPGTTGTVALIIPFSLEAGKRILAVRATVKDSVTGPTTLETSLSTAIAGATYSNAAAFGPASAGTGTIQTIQQTGLSTVVVAGTAYAVTVTQATGVASTTTYSIQVDYDQP